LRAQPLEGGVVVGLVARLRLRCRSLARALARALGVSLDYLADDALDEPPPSEERSEADAMILALARRWGYERAVLQLAESPVIRAAPQPPAKPQGES
jgi:hypothetical protein